jgi:hypothetical protein
MSTKTKSVTLGDLIISEDASPAVTRETKTVTNSSGSEMTLEVGHPMDDTTPVVSGDEANTDGVCLAYTIIENGESADIPVMARGPAAINGNALPTTDYAGSSYTMSTLKSTIESLTIQVREEPDEQEEQTT